MTPQEYAVQEFLRWFSDRRNDLFRYAARYGVKEELCERVQLNYDSLEFYSPRSNVFTIVKLALSDDPNLKAEFARYGPPAGKTTIELRNNHFQIYEKMIYDQDPQ